MELYPILIPFCQNHQLPNGGTPPGPTTSITIVICSNSLGKSIKVALCGVISNFNTFLLES